MQPTTLTIESQPGSNGISSVSQLKGKLVLETVTSFLQQMRPDASQSLVLDMSCVSFIDSAGVGALIQLFVHRRNQKQKFALAALSGQGLAVMEVAGLLKLVPHFATVDEAAAQTV